MRQFLNLRGDSLMNSLPQRKKMRLTGHDYSLKGVYFVTICTKNRRKILSSIEGNDAYLVPKIRLTRTGEIVQYYLDRIDGIDCYVIMPNHIHLIIIKNEYSKTDVIKDIRSLKIMVTKRVGYSIWQTGFYDHIVRDEQDYLAKRQYIEENAIKWLEDEYYNR